MAAGRQAHKVVLAFLAHFDFRQISGWAYIEPVYNEVTKGMSWENGKPMSIRIVSFSGNGITK